MSSAKTYRVVTANQGQWSPVLGKLVGGGWTTVATGLTLEAAEALVRRSPGYRHLEPEEEA